MMSRLTNLKLPTISDLRSELLSLLLLGVLLHVLSKHMFRHLLTPDFSNLVEFHVYLVALTRPDTQAQWSTQKG